MAWTQADIDSLDRQFKDGVQDITFADGRRRSLFSVADYLRLKGEMQKSVRSAAGTTIRRTRVETRKGW